MQTEFLMHLWLKKKKINLQNQTIMTERHTQTVCASSSFTLSLVAQGAVLSYGEKTFLGVNNNRQKQNQKDRHNADETVV